MCGISAIFGENVEDKVPCIEKMLSKIKYRGDKPANIKKFTNCILGCKDWQLQIEKKLYSQ